MNPAIWSLPDVRALEEATPRPTPWEAEPYRLWSLLDMRPIETAAIAQAIANIAISMGASSSVPMTNALVEYVTKAAEKSFRKSLPPGTIVDFSTEWKNPDFFPKAVQERVVESLDGIELDLAEASLPKRFHDKMARVRAVISGDSFDGGVSQALLNELMHDLLTELSEPMFLHIEANKRELFEQKAPPFGLAVEAAFPGSSRDIAAAARCFALDEWTACVCHLMRALEAPLQTLASKMEVKFPGPTDLENWKNIIDQLESKVNQKVKEEEQGKKSHERNQTLKQLGEIALLFRHFKNAWRNDAAHAREWYDERTAQVVYNGVRDFMQKMAEAV